MLPNPQLPRYRPTQISERVQIRQQILHLRLRHYLAKCRHHVAAGHNHLSDAFVIGRHATPREELFLENSPQAAPFLFAGGVGLVTAIAILIIEAPPGCLLRIQSQFSVALAARRVAATANQQESRDYGGGETIAEPQAMV